MKTDTTCGYTWKTRQAILSCQQSIFFVLFALVEVEAQYTMHTILKSDQKIIYYNFAESKGSQKRYDIMI